MKEILKFDNYWIRRSYKQQEQRWYFSITDVIQALLQHATPQISRNYWKVLKGRLKKDGSEVVTMCNQLKLKAGDGKNYLTDVADVQTILRIIQVLPSPKAEPIKLWLAKVGYERIQEAVDPIISLNRAQNNWLYYGHNEKLIERHGLGQENDSVQLANYTSGVSSIDEDEKYTILTNIFNKEWSDLTLWQQEKLNRRSTLEMQKDMSDAEKTLIALAELSTRPFIEEPVDNAQSAKKPVKPKPKIRMTRLMRKKQKEKEMAKRYAESWGDEFSGNSEA